MVASLLRVSAAMPLTMPRGIFSMYLPESMSGMSMRSSRSEGSELCLLKDLRMLVFILFMTDALCSGLWP